jgi:hypothetical protein
MKTTTNIIYLAVAVLALACFGLLPRVQAINPPPDGCYPNYTTAKGCSALSFLSSGAGNTGLGWYALFSDTSGSFNTGVGGGALAINNGDSNTAVGAAALLLNTTGSLNTAVGTDALVYNDSGAGNTANGAFALFNNTTGFDNTASGVDTLLANTAGYDNTASGVGALEANTVGVENTAIGVTALEGNTDGSSNVAIGVNALLSNTTGSTNTAIGQAALFSATGDFNIALGTGAGLEITTGSENIDIGNDGVAGDSNTIRIGDKNVHTAIYVAGIAGQTVGAGGTTCYVDNDGKLGVFLSARRYKENIHDMDDASAALFSLKPVTFRYKRELDKSGTPQFGLIAEEVAAVNPDLVVRNARGELSTVRYEAINVMLLNEFLKEHRKVEKLEAAVADLAGELRRVKAQMQRNSSPLRVAAKDP